MVFLQALPDPRAHNTIHRLVDLVTMAVIAILADCNTWVDVADFCAAR